MSSSSGMGSRKRASSSQAGGSGSSSGNGTGNGSGSGSDNFPNAGANVQDCGEEDQGAHLNKKTNTGSTSSLRSMMDTSVPAGSDVAIHLKILIPSVAAGGIIGKGGDTIAEMQKQTGAKVKMSKSNDFYPGTNERVCLIHGTVESVTYVLDFINDKIRAKPDPHARSAIDFDNKISAEREKQIKVLIPNSTAGMIIGKGGGFIKQIKDESGAFIQLSQKSKDTTLAERVVTIIGEPENNRKAMAMILGKIREDPQSGSSLNISYNDAALVANFNPTGSPYAQQQQLQQQNGATSQDEKQQANSGGSFYLPIAGGGHLSLRFNMNPSRPPTDPSLVSQYLGHVSSSLVTSGYSEAATDDITKSMNCLASHGIVLMNLSPAATSVAQTSPEQVARVGQQQQPQVAAQQQQQSLGPPPQAAFHTVSTAVQRVVPNPYQDSQQAASYNSALLGQQVSYARTTWSTADPRTQEQQQQQQHPPTTYSGTSPRRSTSPSYMHLPQVISQAPANTNSFGLGLSAVAHPPPPPPPLPPPPPPPPGLEDAAEPVEQAEMEVNESIVGAVIGPSGRSIVNMEQYSGARIQISKKGVYSPGTRNRIVTLTGNAKAIASAKYLIDQKVVEEESSRERERSSNF